MPYEPFRPSQISAAIETARQAKSWRESILAVSRETGVPSAHIMGPVRRRKIVRARQIAVAALRARGLSGYRVAQLMDLHHTSVENAEQVIRGLTATFRHRSQP